MRVCQRVRFTTIYKSTSYKYKVAQHVNGFNPNLI